MHAKRWYFEVADMFWIIFVYSIGALDILIYYPQANEMNKRSDRKNMFCMPFKSLVALSGSGSILGSEDHGAV